MGYAVLHIEKGTGSSGCLQSEIRREREVLNADPKLKQENFSIQMHEDGKLYQHKDKDTKSLKDKINNRIKEGYTGKQTIRKDAVTHLKIILSGSHDDMQNLKEKGKITAWAALNYQFLAYKFGLNNVVEFQVHMDERTPHVHAIVVPLTSDGRLSAKEVMGDKRKMSALQDEYGMVMDENFSLQRGIKGSTATHDGIKEFYGRVSEAEEYYNKYEDLKVDAPLKTVIPQIKENPPLLGREKWRRKQNKAILDATKKRDEEIYTRAQRCVSEMKKKAIMSIYDAGKERKKNSQQEGRIKQFINRIAQLEKQILHPEEREERGIKR